MDPASLPRLVAQSLADRLRALPAVVMTGARLLPIEVKATGRPRLGDAKHLRTFRAEYGKKARAGLVLHTGSTLEWLAPDVLAVPWWRVL